MHIGQNVDTKPMNLVQLLFKYNVKTPTWTSEVPTTLEEYNGMLCWSTVMLLILQEENGVRPLYPTFYDHMHISILLNYSGKMQFPNC